MYLLDTNVVINFLDAKLSPDVIKLLSNIIDEQCNVSIITKMEALGFNFKTQEEQHTMEIFIDGSNLIDINTDIINKTISIRKTKKIGLPDAIIAATALSKHFILITNNLQDFKNIPDLQVIAPNNLA